MKALTGCDGIIERWREPIVLRNHKILSEAARQFLDSLTNRKTRGLGREML
jgi:hypothetical protein